MGFSLSQMFTPPKSIRKFQPKKAGNVSWWKDLGKEVGIPAAALLATGGLAGIGPLGGALGGVGGAIGGGVKALGASGLAGAKSLGGKGLSALGGEGEGGGGWLEMGLGGLDAILGARRGAESDKLRDLGVEQMKGQERTRSDLLARALGLDPNAPNPSLAGIFADPSNPFARQGGGQGGGQGQGLPPRRSDPSVVDASGVGGLGSEAEAKRRLQEMGFPPPGGSTLGQALGDPKPFKKLRKGQALQRATSGPRQRAM